MYQLPGDVNLAGFFQVREGYVFDPTVRVGRDNIGTLTRSTVEFGSQRLPTFWNLDLRAEKTFDIEDRARAHVILDAFNLTSNDIVLDRTNSLTSSNFNRIEEVVQGRTIRLALDAGVAGQGVAVHPGRDQFTGRAGHHGAESR